MVHSPFTEVLHMVPILLNFIEVRAVTRPIYHLERLHSQEKP
jgi:hypothetical protein